MMLALAVLLAPFFARAEKFCLIADIHNGSGTKKASKANVIYPKHGNRYFKEALRRAKESKVDACIVLGDNANTGKRKEAKELVKTAKKSGVRVIWVKGNHDSRRSQKYLSDRTNYIVNFRNVRVVVLDSNTGNTAGNGGVSAENRGFYQRALNTNKKIVLAMHHPPFQKNISSHPWNHEYDWIGDEPDYVLGGHYHLGWKKGKYIAVKALTLQKHLEMRYIKL